MPPDVAPDIAVGPVGQRLHLHDAATLIYLDFAGTLPPVAVTRAFLEDKSADKREKLIDQLLSAPAYADRMADLWHVMLMERFDEAIALLRDGPAGKLVLVPWGQSA